MGEFVKQIIKKDIKYIIEKVNDHYIVINTQRPKNIFKARKGLEFEMGENFKSVEEAEKFINL